MDFIPNAMAIYVQCIYLITINIHVEVDLNYWALIWGAWPTPLFGRLGGLMPSNLNSGIT